MNRRSFVSHAILATAFVALAASGASAASSPGTILKPRPSGPSAPGNLAAPGGGAKPTAGYQHDSDAQLDIWVARCNKAGGGMELGNDGNYRCVDPQGHDINDW
jgi:hypothetical protein